MLPKIHRLAKKKDFDAVFSGGKKAKRGFLLFVVNKNTLSENRIGFVVSKKISAKATVRNAVKRRLRKAVALHLPEVKTSYDLIIVAMPGTEKKEFSEIELVVSRFLKEL